ncbi:hypothetical protein Tco_1072767 [Tanacetum coccineum]
MPRILIPLRHILGVLQYTLGIMGRRFEDEMWLDVAGLHTTEDMAEDGFGAYWHAEGRKSGAMLSGGYFIRRLAHHFGLVNDDGLRGLSVVAHNIECTAE